ncbi:MAG TPA: glycosyl transferase family protein [Bryobacteraceae bacterium]|nr:glycosyl transferase family protein [Bryobacteraceae bacterium]
MYVALVQVLDNVVSTGLAPLAWFILLNGLDDLVIDVALLWERGHRPQNEPNAATSRPEQRVAILVPLWKEANVIGPMIRHNVAAIRYSRYDFFIGSYPNDEPTLEAIRELEQRFANIHLAVCPHDGPTSKADCLNWTFQRMTLFEEQHGVRFDIVVTHDAEDLIHPDALARINAHCSDYGMVQVPVLPLPTPVRDFIHGIYCDEFAEYQTRDIPGRQILGSFLPSNGVGTGFSREALERLAEISANRIFEPECLTEDYENGLRLHRLGFRQKFLPLSGGREAMATREYFPRTRRGAIRQRTRWITGICLQSWERNGWRAGPRDLYWFWRDRKGLLTNPVSILANLFFAWGLLHGSLGELHPALAAAVLAMTLYRIGVRMVCVARFYGWPFAALTPLRMVFANYVNAVATLSALLRYLRARLRGEPLVWLKTDHAYPSRQALLAHKRPLAEILTGSGYVRAQDIALAAASCTNDSELGDYLIRAGFLSEDEYCEALSLQQGLPSGHVAPRDVERRAVRAMPRTVLREFHVLPFRLSEGTLMVATPRTPDESVTAALTRFTRLRLVFHLTTSSNFAELERSFGNK